MEGTIVFFTREKKPSRKIKTFCPRSFESAREQNLKTAGEHKIVPEKKKANPTRGKTIVTREKLHNFPPNFQKII